MTSNLFQMKDNVAVTTGSGQGTTALHLVSPAGAHITGEILEGDGGSHLPPAAL